MRTNKLKVLPLKGLLMTAVLGCFCFVVTAEDTYTHYSEWLTASEMKRVPHPYNLDFSSSPRWSYVMGIELESFLDTWLTYGNDKIMDYLKEYPEKMMTARETSLSINTAISILTMCAPDGLS